MDNPIAITFAKSFDAADPKHVTWWKLLCDNMENDALKIAKLNPMGVEFKDTDLLNLVFIQFSIAMKYAQATLAGKSWSPCTR